MSWNKPVAKSAIEKRGSSWLKWAVLLACIFFVLTAICFLTIQSERQPDETVKEPVKKIAIAQSKTNQAHKAVAVQKDSKEMTVDERIKHFHELYGENLPRNIRQVVHYLKNPPVKTFRPAKQKYDIFKRASEKDIAAMLLVEPGSWLMRQPTFGPKFDQDLAIALKEEIKIEESDTEEQRELKQAVIDSKAELAERMKAGEKPSDVMNAMGEAYYQMGLYKRNLEDQVRAVRKDATKSDDDVKDAVDAVNLMLKEKGIAPIKMPNMVLRRASLRLATSKSAKDNVKPNKVNK